MRSAPADVLDNLRQVVERFEDALDAWLAGSKASRTPPSREYLAFSALRMAADLA